VRRRELLKALIAAPLTLLGMRATVTAVPAPEIEILFREYLIDEMHQTYGILAIDTYAAVDTYKSGYGQIKVIPPRYHR